MSLYPKLAYLISSSSCYGFSWANPPFTFTAIEAERSRRSVNGPWRRGGGLSESGILSGTHSNNSHIQRAVQWCFIPDIWELAIISISERPTLGILVDWLPKYCPSLPATYLAHLLLVAHCVSRPPLCRPGPRWLRPAVLNSNFMAIHPSAAQICPVEFRLKFTVNWPRIAAAAGSCSARRLPVIRSHCNTIAATYGVTQITFMGKPSKTWINGSMVAEADKEISF